MRRLLIPSVFGVVMLCGLQASAAVDPKIHKLCAKVSDYVGCVKLNSATEPLQAVPSGTNAAKSRLKDELKKLGARIINSSLMTLSANVRDFRDILSLSKPEDVGSELYKNAKLIDLGIDQLRSYWDSKIKIRGLASSCRYTKATADAFNATFGGIAVSDRCDKSCGLFGCSDTGRDLTYDLAEALEKAASMVAETESFGFPQLPFDPKTKDCGKQPNKASFNKCMSGG